MRHVCERSPAKSTSKSFFPMQLILLAVVLCGSSTHGQTQSGATPKKARTFEDYELRTLKEIAETKAEGDSLGNMEETMWVYSNNMPSRVRVTYTGSKRPASATKKEALRQWARLYAGFPEGYTGPYQTEMLFVEDHKEYWLAVRTTALPLLEKELKQGEAVDLCLIRVGSAKTSSASPEWEPVLLVELFQKAK
jgi:hypothetical protein